MVSPGSMSHRDDNYELGVWAEAWESGKAPFRFPFMRLRGQLCRVSGHRKSADLGPRGSKLCDLSKILRLPLNVRQSTWHSTPFGGGAGSVWRVLGAAEQ